MESQKIFWTGNDVILWHQSLYCDAIIRLAVNILAMLSI